MQDDKKDDSRDPYVSSFFHTLDLAYSCFCHSNEGVLKALPNITNLLNML